VTAHLVREQPLGHLGEVGGVAAVEAQAHRDEPTRMRYE